MNSDLPDRFDPGLKNQGGTNELAVVGSGALDFEEATGTHRCDFRRGCQNGVT